MSMKAKFVRWVLLFGAIGFLISAVAATRYFAFGHSFGELEAKLWPSSVMFLALEAPNTRTVDIVVVWIMAIIANVISYAVIGLLTWPLAYIVARVVARVRAPHVNC
jgi:hypothetical protein